MFNNLTLPKVTIIIPHRDSKYISECLDNCLDLDYPDYEIIVVTSSSLQAEHPKIMIIETSDISQAQKRDLAIAEAKGEICAFIDDDCFPRRDWLKNAIKYFSDLTIAGVGGPGLSPENDSILQKASGAIYESILLKSYRYLQKSTRFVDDYPAFNLLIRKAILQEIGGFRSTYRSGGDTKLCLEVMRSGKRIIYVGDVVVFHHRRPLFMPHLRQAFTYGRHRGHFAKKYPETSRRIEYFLPTILCSVILTMAVLSTYYDVFIPILSLTLLSQLIVGFILGLLSTHRIDIALLTSFSIPLTLWTYGIAFIDGILTDPRKHYREPKKIT